MAEKEKKAADRQGAHGKGQGARGVGSSEGLDGEVVTDGGPEGVRRGLADCLVIGAVPKDAQWEDVRVVHDGTHGLRVNSHLTQPNKMLFPQYDDLEAMLREFRKSATPRRFLLAFDVKAVHRLVPIHGQDWGFQACRLDNENEVYFNTRGSFGEASAAFWWEDWPEHYSVQGAAPPGTRGGHPLLDALRRTMGSMSPRGKSTTLCRWPCSSTWRSRTSPCPGPRRVEGLKLNGLATPWT